MGKTLRRVRQAHRKQAQGKTYVELCAEFPLRPIRSEHEYNRAVARMEQLLAEDSANGSSDDADYMEILALLIALYAERYYEYDGSMAESDMHMLGIFVSGAPNMAASALEDWLYEHTSMPRDRARRVSRAEEALTRGEIAELAERLHVSQANFTVGHRRRKR